MKIVFLDRDGVINEFPGNGNYVTKVKDFHFIPGSIEAIRRLTKAGYTIFIVSNQAGVGKGVYTQKKLDHITRNMVRAVRQAGGNIKKAFYCTHKSDVGCWCRKPGIGSIRRGLALMKKSMTAASKTYFVGDTGIDVQAGHKAGCKTIFVLSGREDRRYIRKWGVRPDYIAKNLLEASEIILAKTSRSKHS
ncbi:MAG: HAD-IIIA family hydrolase [Candidatus Omnitrophica bacterium]|nr:HAD-IIIA family hydrolase [Candidatus Omnitrophota bacterium]